VKAATTELERVAHHDIQLDPSKRGNVSSVWLFGSSTHFQDELGITLPRQEIDIPASRQQQMPRASLSLA